MVLDAGAQPSSPWEQFALRNKFGHHSNKNNRKESKKAGRRGKSKDTFSAPRQRKKKKKNLILKELLQSHITNDGNTIYNDAQVFGNKPLKKLPFTFPVGMQNVNMLPESARHYKSRQLVNHIREGEYDIFFMNEVRLYWNKLDACDQWAERVTSLNDSTAIFANNTTELELSETLQYGGVGMVATGETKHQILSRGKDPTGMGRWVWMRMEGKANLHVRLVTAYRPCESGGTSTVFQQHSRALAKKGDFRNPRTAILEDLAEAIIEWKTLGDHVILAMDANEDVRFGEVNDTFSKAGLREIILDLHRDKSPPATYNRNTQRQKPSTVCEPPVALHQRQEDTMLLAKAAHPTTGDCTSKQRTLPPLANAHPGPCLPYIRSDLRQRILGSPRNTASKSKPKWLPADSNRASTTLN
jgi:hypothetical protein